MKRGHGEQAQLPSGYTKIESVYGKGFIERGGGDYIAAALTTDIFADENTEIFLDYKCNDQYSERNFIGVRNPNLAVITYGSASKIGAMTYGNQNVQAIPFDNARHTYHLSSDNFTIDGIHYGNMTKHNFNSSVPISVFMSNNSSFIGGLAAASEGYVYSFWIKNSGVMQLCGVPALRDVDGKVGFYDIIGNRFLPSNNGIEFENK